MKSDGVIPCGTTQYAGTGCASVRRTRKQSVAPPSFAYACPPSFSTSFRASHSPASSTDHGAAGSRKVVSDAPPSRSSARSPPAVKARSSNVAMISDGSRAASDASSAAASPPPAAFAPPGAIAPGSVVGAASGAG